MSLFTFTPNTIIKSSQINANFAGLADGSEMNSPTFEDVTLRRFNADGLYDNGNSGASKDIDWTNGDRQKLTVTASTTLTFSGAIAGKVLTLEIIEDGTGGYTITLPTLKWPGGLAGAFTTTANAKNTITMFYDGTDYLAQIGAGYA